MMLHADLLLLCAGSVVAMIVLGSYCQLFDDDVRCGRRCAFLVLASVRRRAFQGANPVAEARPENS